MFNKKNILAFASVPFLIMQASAGGSGESFSDNLYVSGNYGVAMNRTKPSYGYEYENEKTPKNANVFGFGVGYKLNENFRSELKYMHFGASEYQADDAEIGSDDIMKHTVRSNALFVNLYYDFDEIVKGLSPYVTVGAGYSKNKSGNSVDYESDGDSEIIRQGKTTNSFAWNVGTGLSYKMSKKVSWDVIQYNYSDLGKYSTKAYSAGGPLKGRVKVHTFTTGIRISL